MTRQITFPAFNETEQRERARILLQLLETKITIRGKIYNNLQGHFVTATNLEQTYSRTTEGVTSPLRSK